jgi:hypothetical protein
LFAKQGFSQDEISSTGNKEIVFSVEQKINSVYVPRTKAIVVVKPDGKQGLAFPDKNGIFGDDLKHFKKLLETDELYTLRIRSLSGNASVPWVTTSIPAVNTHI